MHFSCIDTNDRPIHLIRPYPKTANGTTNAAAKVAHLESQNAQLSRQLSDLTQDTERTEQALVEKDVLLERTRERVKVLERESAGWSKRIEQQVSRMTPARRRRPICRRTDLIGSVGV